MNELTLTLRWIAEAAGGRLELGTAGESVGAVAIDSRSLGPGEFFVALKGPRHDGHDHVIDAARRGASGALVDAAWLERNGQALRASATGGFGVIAVADTLSGLQQMARTLRRAVQTQVVAITGSAGKTTTKELIAAMLATSFTVVKNRGNLNNHIGLPLSLMELRRRPDVAVMELGMNHRGEISALVNIADPDVRVWTNVGDAHLGFFADANEIADAKAEILEAAAPSDVLIYGADDPRITSRVAAFPGEAVGFGYSEAAQVRAVDVEDLGVAGMRARLITADGDRQIETPLLGRGNLANVLAAAATALHFGLTPDAIARYAKDARPADRRGSVIQAQGVTIIDDSYNSSPSALRRALEVVRHERGASRKVGVLGEMLELGEHADQLHRECGSAAAEAGLSLLVTVGGAPARALAEGAIAGGMPAASVHHVEGAAAAADLAAGVVQAGDLVLVKGSRGIRTDLVVDRLMAGTA